MLKRIRKSSKHMVRGKSLEVIDKTEGTAQGERKWQSQSDALKKEVENLKLEIMNLKDELDKEKARYGELKTLKTQQVSALTLKLATAMRQKEKALEEVDKVKLDLHQLKEHLNTTEDDRASDDITVGNDLEKKADVQDAIDGGNRTSTPAQHDAREVIEYSEQEKVEKEVAGSPWCSSSQKNGDGKIPRSKVNRHQETHFGVTSFPIRPEVDKSAEGNLNGLANGHVEETQDLGPYVEFGATQFVETGPSNSQLSTESGNCSDSENENYTRKVFSEFTRIQQELCEVKESMSIIQALNKHLSNNLQFLADKSREARLQKGMRSESLRRRNMASSEQSLQEIMGASPKSFTLPQEMIERKGTQELQDFAEAERRNTVHNSPTDSKYKETSSASICEKWKDEEIDVKKQLFKALEELEDLRSDNQEMKEQMRKISSSSVQETENFVTRTTQYTDEILRNMRARDLNIDQTSRSEDYDSGFLSTHGLASPLDSTLPRNNALWANSPTECRPSAETTGYPTRQPPVSAMGTRLHQITRTVDDMTRRTEEPSTKIPLLHSSESRPQSADLFTSQNSPFKHAPDVASFPGFYSVVPSCKASFPEAATSQYSAAHYKKPGDEATPNALAEVLEESPVLDKNRRYAASAKLGEPGLGYDVGRIVHLNQGVDLLRDGAKNSLDLTKAWRSSETLPRASYFTGTPGYRDFIQRHIVLSSNSIAKIRDLKPEELDEFTA